jgi:hypothetical protein
MDEQDEASASSSPAAATDKQDSDGRVLVLNRRQRLLRFLSGDGQQSDWRLRVPPDPPLFSEHALEPVLRDVGLLLDYLNRLPDMRLEQCFRPAPAQHPAAASVLTPPCQSQSYFLGRIAAIAALGKAARPNDITEPPAGNAPAGGGATGAVPDTVGSSLGNLAFLIWSRDLLAAVSSPATLDTIRVTRAYRAGRMMEPVVLRTTGNGHGTADERDLFMSRYGLEIARRMRLFQLLAIFLLWFSLYLSSMVYSGQVLMAENAALQTGWAAHETRLREAVAEDANLVQASLHAGQRPALPLLALEYCAMRPSTGVPPRLEVVRLASASTSSGDLAAPTLADPGTAVPPTAQVYISDRQRSLCEEREHLAKRESELRRSHGVWTEAASPVIALSSPLPGMIYFARTLQRELFHWTDQPPDRTLESERYATEQLINGLLAGIMPAMYAALGALASLFRRLAQKAEEERLGPADHGGMMSSLVLGGLTGAVIGLFVNVVPQGGQGAASAGLPLTTTALALLAGYAADRVFAMFDNIAQRVFVLPAKAETRAG